ncbi:MAG TPA: aspartyl protease family protein [Candidatus Angelobacter sp.]|nr:aspartyl protease family protein [Candidatus Angelobacter sp.]
MLLCFFLSLALACQTVSTVYAADLLSAQEFVKQGQFRKAADAYRSILAKMPSSTEAHAGLVRSLLKLDEVDAADTASQAALAALPQSAAVHAARGDVYFRRGLMDGAEGEYKTSLAIDANCARALLGLGRVYAAESRRSKARDLFAKAHALAPNDGDTLYYWAINLQYPQNAEALAQHLAQFRDDPDKERREREYLEFIEALAGRDIWVLSHPMERSEIKLENLLAPAQHSGITDRPSAPLSAGSSMTLSGLGLRVSLNGVTKTLLLDTGASGVTIPKNLADKIGARRLSEQSLEGVGNSGAASGYNAWVDKISIGELEFHDCVVHVSLRNDSGQADGIIGSDIFDRYLVTIDFPGRKLTLGPLPEAEEKSEEEIAAHGAFSRVFSFGHLLLVPTHINPDASGLFIIDTGAYSDFISPALARKTGGVGNSSSVVQGRSGKVKDVYEAGSVVLQFSRYKQPSENIRAIDLHPQSKTLGAEVSGFLGFPALRHMKLKINYRDGLVDFESKP